MNERGYYKQIKCWQHTEISQAVHTQLPYKDTILISTGRPNP